jgi:hypothetical protein
MYSTDGGVRRDSRQAIRSRAVRGVGLSCSPRWRAPSQLSLDPKRPPTTKCQVKQPRMGGTISYEINVLRLLTQSSKSGGHLRATPTRPSQTPLLPSRLRQFRFSYVIRSVSPLRLFPALLSPFGPTATPSRARPNPFECLPSVPVARLPPLPSTSPPSGEEAATSKAAIDEHTCIFTNHNTPVLPVSYFEEGTCIASNEARRCN